MSDHLDQITALKEEFVQDLKDGRQTPWQLLKDKRFKSLAASLGKLPVADRQKVGKALNDLKNFLQQEAGKLSQESQLSIDYLDVTAPFDLNSDQRPDLLPAENGSIHPIYQAQAELVTILNKMGFTALESRQLDSEFYMFDSLNFPDQHPARAEFDTFFLQEKDPKGNPLVCSASHLDYATSGFKAGERAARKRSAARGCYSGSSF